MIRRALLMVFCCSILGCSTGSPEEVEAKTKENSSPTAAQYQIIVTEQSNGFGYQILKDGQLTIDQPTIPAIQGNQSFSSKEKAQKTAEFLIDKLNKGIFPPTISVEELDSLEVL